MQLVRQSTTTTIYVGPVLDSTGAAVTTAVLGDFRIVKNGTAATLTGATVTHDANGYYTIALTTTNTDTTGQLTLAVGNTAQSMSTHRYSVLLPSVFDALITNATNATGGLPTATGAITALAGTIATSTNITSATGVTLAGVTHTGAVIPTVSDVTTKTGYSLSSAGVQAIWDALTSALTAVGSIGKLFVDNINATISSRSTYAGGDTSGTTTLLSRIASALTIISGKVTVGTNDDKTGYELKDPAPTLAQIEASTVLAKESTVSSVPGLVWSQLTTATWPNNSFGKQVVIGSSAHRAITISGSESGHVACVVHGAEPNSIPENAFIAGALSARALAADAATEIATAVAGIQVLSRLDSMVESNGSGQFRFDTIALGLAPAGGGGGTVNITVEDSSITIG